MRLETIGWRGPSRHALVGVACGALLTVVGALTGCASPPAPVVAAPKAPTRAEQIVAALKAMSFEQREDGWQLSLPAPLVFQFDSDTVSPDAHGNLVRIARELRTLGIAQVLVRGHTDTVGAREYNMALSKRRADAVARVLGEGGFPSEGIDAKGLGSSVPVADNTTNEGRAKNRRVVIIVQVDGPVSS
jgi:outer membrane protein OmpA-like peptidoglycan-associated protein